MGKFWGIFWGTTSKFWGTAHSVAEFFSLFKQELVRKICVRRFEFAYRVAHEKPYDGFIYAALRATRLKGRAQIVKSVVG